MILFFIIFRYSNDSLHGSQDGSLAMDLHLPNDYSVTLKVRDKTRRRPLTRQRPVDEESAAEPMEYIPHSSSRRSSHSHVVGCRDFSPRLPLKGTLSAGLPSSQGNLNYGENS